MLGMQRLGCQVSCVAGGRPPPPPPHRPQNGCLISQAPLQLIPSQVPAVGRVGGSRFRGVASPGELPELRGSMSTTRSASRLQILMGALALVSAAAIAAVWLILIQRPTASDSPPAPSP